MAKDKDIDAKNYDAELKQLNQELKKTIDYGLLKQYDTI